MVRVAAVAGRMESRARAFADELGIPTAYGSYEALLADPEIEAVYIPLPNSLHGLWTIRAAEAGKHVLCEKPLAGTEEEAAAMFAAADRAGVKLVEAFPYRFQPQTLRTRELVESDAIGEVRLIRASFGFTVRDQGDIRYNPDLAGGALMDVGSYPVNLAVLVAGCRPLQAYAVADWASTGVDRTLVGILEFPNKVLAQISCSFATGVHRHALIAGTAGVIETEFLNHPADQDKASIRLKSGTEWIWSYDTVSTEPGNGFLAEADAFARLIRFGDAGWQGPTPAESLDTMAAIDALYRSARTGQSVDVRPARAR